MPQANGGPPLDVTGLSTFVTTKAAADLFLPSITAIEFIAHLDEPRDMPQERELSFVRSNLFWRDRQ